MSRSTMRLVCYGLAAVIVLIAGYRSAMQQWTAYQVKQAAVKRQVESLWNAHRKFEVEQNQGLWEYERLKQRVTERPPRDPKLRELVESSFQQMKSASAAQQRLQATILAKIKKLDPDGKYTPPEYQAMPDPE